MREVKLVNIGDVFKIASGGTPSRKKAKYFEGGKIPWVKTGDLKGKFVNFPKELITEDALNNSSAKLFPKNTVLLAMYGATIGACSILNFEAATNQACAAFLPTDKCNVSYLYYFLASKKNDLVRMGVGGAQPNISAGIIKKIQIPLPPLSEQKKIAAILDEAEHLRQLNQDLLDEYDALTQALFLDMFGDSKLNPKKWRVSHLEDLCTHIIDCPHSTPRYIDEITIYPCIRTTELKKGAINWDKMKYLDKEGFIKRTKRLEPEGGDIIYGREGTFGEAIIIPPNIKMSLGQRVVLFRPNYIIINSSFLHAVLRSKGVYHQALRYNTGSTVGHVNIKDIKKFKLITPPLALQTEFAKRIQVIEAQKAQAKAALAESEDLFNALLQRAFKGELTASV